MIKKFTLTTCCALVVLSLLSCTSTKVNEKETTKDNTEKEVVVQSTKKEETTENKEEKEISKEEKDALKKKEKEEKKAKALEEKKAKEAEKKKKAEEKRKAKEDAKLAQITKSEDSLFWTIKGKDKNKKESILYVLGTFTYADSSIYPLNEDVEKAFCESTRYVSKISSIMLNEIYKDRVERLAGSNYKEKIYITDNDGKSYLDNFEKNEIELIKTLFGEDAVKLHSEFEPWVLLEKLREVPYLLSRLDSRYNLSNILIARLENNGKECEGLEDVKVTMDINESGIRSEHINEIHKILANLLKNPEQEMDYVKNLYLSYLKGDEKEVSSLFNKWNKPSNDYEKEYYNKSITLRNISYAAQMETLLEEGGVTFIFIDFTHLVGKDNVFDIMKNDGILQK